MGKRPSGPPDTKRKAATTAPPAERAPAPPKTRTLPEALRGAAYDGPDVATMLQDYDTDVRFELPRDQTTFTLGSSPECDVAIRDEYVSGLHCTLQRRGGALRVYDQSSYNGTFFDGRRVDVFDPRPGDTFVAGRVRLLVLNDEMKAGYPVLSEIVGSGDEATLTRSSGGVDASPCDLIVAAKGGANLLITGDPGCDQERLAATIHGISLRRRRDLVQLDDDPRDRNIERGILDRASRSTLVLTIRPTTPVMDPTFVSNLFSSSFQIRVIAIAPNAATARSVLGDSYVTTMRLIPLAPLAQRPGAILRLLDHIFAEKGAALRISDLTQENQLALQSYAWPKNFDELREAADRLIEVARAEGSVAGAAKKLKISPSSMHYWFSDQLGLAQPLLTSQSAQRAVPA